MAGNKSKRINAQKKRLDTLATQTERQKKSVLAELIRYPVVQAAVAKVGVGRATFYLWMKEDKEIGKLASKTRAEGQRFVNDLAESQVIRLIQDGYFPACVYWLRHHHEEYEERVSQKHEHHIDFESSRELTLEEKESITRSLINLGLQGVIRMNRETLEQKMQEKAKEVKKVAKFGARNKLKDLLTKEELEELQRPEEV